MWFPEQPWVVPHAGTRSDDPNDLVPHEHRRELRAGPCFGAWTNLVDPRPATPSMPWSRKAAVPS
jgi:hypothetical protein